MPFNFGSAQYRMLKNCFHSWEFVHQHCPGTWPATMWKWLYSAWPEGAALDVHHNGTQIQVHWWEAQTQHLSALSTQLYQICYLHIQIIYNHFASSVLVPRVAAGKELYSLAMQSVKHALLVCHALCAGGAMCNFQIHPCHAYEEHGVCIRHWWTAARKQEHAGILHFRRINHLVKISFQTPHTLHINFSSEKVCISMREGNLKN